MKKLILLLLFIPLVSFGQDDKLKNLENSYVKSSQNVNKQKVVLPDFSTTKKKINYIKKFKSWKHFLDHFETRQQVNNFFGSRITKKYKKWSEYIWVEMENKEYYSAPSSSSSGNVSYNSLSNSINYSGESTNNEGGLYNISYWFNFKFSKGTFTHPSKYSNNVLEWDTSFDMKNISNAKFRSLIKRYYSTSKKEEYQYKRDGWE